MLALRPALIRAASTDAGNRSMRKGGRSAWSECDQNAAFNEFWHLALVSGYATQDVAMESGYEIQQARKTRRGRGAA